MKFTQNLAVLGYFLRRLGALVLAVAAGWSARQTLKPETFQRAPPPPWGTPLASDSG